MRGAQILRGDDLVKDLRCNSVDANIPRPSLQRGALGETNDRVLTGDVRAAAIKRLKAVDAGHVDDTASRW